MFLVRSSVFKIIQSSSSGLPFRTSKLNFNTYKIPDLPFCSISASNKFSAKANMTSTDELTVQERNKQIVARYSEEFWGKCNENIVDELCSDDFVSNYPMHGRREGKAEVKRKLTRGLW
jgi:hypothetical protein